MTVTEEIYLEENDNFEFEKVGRFSVYHLFHNVP